MTRFTRRTFCATTSSCGPILLAGCMESSQNGNNTTTSGSPSITQAIYVWDCSEILSTDTHAAEHFFEQLDQYNIDNIFLSWGALQSTSISDRKSFIKNSHERDMQVHALVGTAGEHAVSNAEQTIPQILDYNNEASAVAEFDGIHLNAEPRSVDLDVFLDEYRTMLDRIEDENIIQDGDLILSSAIGWWWGNTSSAKTSQLVEHSLLDYTVVMAYWNTEEEIRNRLSAVVSETEAPYLLAMETQEFPKDTTDTRVSFYEQGQDVVETVRENIVADPPTADLMGIAYHYYQSSISKWNAIQKIELSESSVRPGDTVNITCTVIFNNDFPNSFNKSKLIVEIDGTGSEYTFSEVIEPPSRQQESISIDWTVPSDIQSGEYSVTATLYDIVFVDTSREAVNRRQDPVELDKKTAGEINIAHSDDS